MGSSIAVSCGVDHRCGSDPVLQWLWGRLAAVAQIEPLPLELPYAVGAALKKKQKKKISPNVLQILVSKFILDFPLPNLVKN